MCPKTLSPFPITIGFGWEVSLTWHLLGISEWITMYVIGCLIWLSINVAEGLWIRANIKGGSSPNPGTPVTKPHKSWKLFSIALYVYGYCMWSTALCGGFILRSSLCSVPLSHGSIGKELGSCSSLQWPSWLVWPLSSCLSFPSACSTGAWILVWMSSNWHSFSIKWTHFCDSFPGEAILTGTADPTQPPTMSLYCTIWINSAVPCPQPCGRGRNRTLVPCPRDIGRGW